jgi:hypothetical protein
MHLRHFRRLALCLPLTRQAWAQPITPSLKRYSGGSTLQSVYRVTVGRGRAVVPVALPGGGADD